MKQTVLLDCAVDKRVYFGVLDFPTLNPIRTLAFKK